MQRLSRYFLFGLLTLALGAVSLPAGAEHLPAEPPHDSKNMHLLAQIPTKPTFTNSDLAFWGNRVYAGNYGGFRIIDITDPPNPVLVTDFDCPGPQNDVSVWDRDGDGAADLLFLSVDSPRDNQTCASGPTTASDPDSWEGVRIIDITDEQNPFQIEAVGTDCGSHTHTLVPGTGANSGFVYIYVSSYPLGLAAVGGPGSDGQECFEPHSKISIIKVPLANPAGATVIERNLDGATLEVERTVAGPSPGTQVTQRFKACHDINVFMPFNLAAGSCWTEGQIWDISNPESPLFLRRIRNPHISDLFHSATFTWDGQIVVFEDEAGGGGAARCQDPRDLQGRVWFYNLALNELGSFKIPRPQGNDEPCTAHNFNAVPVTNDRYTLVSAWYYGGTSVIDFTNPDNAREIAFYESDTADGSLFPTDFWSSYWYNDFIHASDGLQRTSPDTNDRGHEVYEVTNNRFRHAVMLDHLNPQTQEVLID